MRKCIGAVLAVLFFMPDTPASGEAISDLSREQFEQGAAALSPIQRSPFVPAYQTGEDIDIATLLAQGIIFGKKLKMALLSGRIVREGEAIGRYTVEKIDPDQVELSSGANRYTLKIENYFEPLGKRSAGKFTVELRNAGLRETLRFLAKGAALNIIMPEDLGGRVTISFDNIELMEAIRSVLRVNGFEYAVESGVVRVGKPDAFAGGTDLRTQNFRLKYATAKELVEKVKPLLSDRGAAVSDDRTNTLMVKDRDAVVATISGLVGALDKKDQQVRIEARIVDASRNFSRSLGIRWGVRANKDNVSVAGTADVGISTDSGNPINVNLGATGPTSGLGMIVGNILGGGNLEAQLTMAEEKGDVHILSRPSVTTLNNMPAKIRSGTKVYVKSTSSISLGTAGGTTATGGTAGLQEIDTGIELTVTPQISIDDYIKMKIEAVESEVDFTRTVDGIPAVIDNTATTTVILKDGETTVIGGLYRTRTSKSKRGVPGLQQIPVIGLLFQSRTKTKADSELMIFITPKIQ